MIGSRSLAQRRRTVPRSATRTSSPALTATALVLATAMLLGEDIAFAYKCTPVMDANPEITQAWVSRCIPYWIYGSGPDLQATSMDELVHTSFEVWSNNLCTDLEFVDAGPTTNTPGFDPRRPDEQRNVIAWFDDRTEVARYISSVGLLGATLTWHSTQTGEIFDADIILNGAYFRLDDIEDQTACEEAAGRDRAYDLRSTLVHEIGHFIGFDHDLDADSTMLATAEPCEIKKRDLTGDNLLGLCTVYPAGKPTATCQPPAAGYDSNGGDPTAFRDQCARLAGDGDCQCHHLGERDGAAAGLTPSARGARAQSRSQSRSGWNWLWPSALLTSLVVLRRRSVRFNGR
ncbi:MAG: matrixin family metalloprotease [Deltaproteobacteria bacterium]|nr:matrixin family metalloprotease [Deltaproteobacteria bacterium]